MKAKEYRTRMVRELLDHEFILYVIKCVVGAAICYFFYSMWPERNFHWSIISVLLVLAPDRANSLTLPVMRIKANIIGGLMGFLVFVAPFEQVVALILGVVLTILACKMLLSENAIRSALAALVIVALMEGDVGGWQLALDRMLSVIIGCMIALILTVVFSVLDKGATTSVKGE